jgi:8-oxo-dGTP pyrophosphatase MutT (NUDIX family)
VGELFRSFQRIGMRVAYRVLQVYWFFRRPAANGVKCVVMRGDELVLVRHTYGRRGTWDLPGGGLKRGETPQIAARREVREELGLDLDGWRELGRTNLVVDHKRNRLNGCATPLAGGEIVADEIEIAEARWFGRSALPEPLTPWVRQFTDAAFEGRRIESGP